MFVRTIAQSANLRAFIHPMLRRLQEYDQAHSTALLHTLCVYLLQEQNLHATARQLFIHRNTLADHLNLIKRILGTDLEAMDEIFSFYLGLCAYDLLRET